MECWSPCATTVPRVATTPRSRRTRWSRDSACPQCSQRSNRACPKHQHRVCADARRSEANVPGLAQCHGLGAAALSGAHTQFPASTHPSLGFALTHSPSFRNTWQWPFRAQGRRTKLRAWKNESVEETERLRTLRFNALATHLQTAGGSLRLVHESEASVVCVRLWQVRGVRAAPCLVADSACCVNWRHRRTS